ncbi:CHAT domain-containing protein [Actinophytocola xanthii]|uniref:CHAT domain-containing protein n=1 Tax=Actinophytocola xanthii TaxID=1912961 RepID=A0A1Q8CVU2_9PSEU|nr:CHAT domain-containing protein [Actinophytocola xanthii]OLF18476.1 CHAT domain-containing protein [Actinophytocola xanthii]
MPREPAEEAVEARARELHRRGLEALNRGRPLLGARSLRAGLRLLGWPEPAGRWPEHRELTFRLLGSLAAAEVACGNSDRGFALLDGTGALIAEHNRGVLLLQRGLLLTMTGRVEEAVRSFDAAVPLLERAGERVALARTLLNRAFIHQIAGQVRPALADLARSEQLSRELGMTVQVAKSFHGRGSCLLLAGDVPGALRAFDQAEQGYAENADGMLVVLAVEKARALLAAGLAVDAAEVLDAALPGFAGLGMTQEQAEAELTRAQIALAVGDHAAATRWAARARRRFRRRRNEAWAAVAALTRLRAEFADGRRAVAAAGTASELAERLRALGLDNDAEAAELLAARAHLSRGQVDLAAERVRRQPGRRSRLDTRLQRHVVRARIASARGDHPATFRHARAGLVRLAEHRSHFGSIDLQTGVATLGAELARAGLDAALAVGRPATVFRWLEHSRAQAFRSRAVHPTDDPATVDAVAELRQLSRVARASELEGRRDPVAARRCAELERQIRAQSWQTSGTGEHDAQAELAEVRAELAAAGTALVSFFTVGTRIHAFLAGDRVARIVALGDLPTVTESIMRLRSDLDVLSGRALPAPLDAAVRTSARRQLGVLTEHLLAPLRPSLGDEDLVVVPTGPLSGVPWALLPDLRGRPVTVSPSATVWLSARRAALAPPAGTLLVAGPDLEHAADEVEQLARIYPEGETLVGADATVESAIKALDGCGIAHFAAHGHHEQDSVLFSRLDLADGPLLAYDIHRLGAAPEHVILASCDVGKTVVRAGDEMLGFTAALLYSGTRTVVSSVARMNDHAAVGVMTAYHRALARGAAPARALADATLTEPLTPLVCFGSG